MVSSPLGPILFAALLIVTSTGCVYRMDIPQGNRIDAGLVDQLEIGMSRNQVKFLLGTPAVEDLYHPDIWHYIYFYKTGRDGNIEKRRCLSPDPFRIQRPNPENAFPSCLIPFCSFDIGLCVTF